MSKPNFFLIGAPRSGTTSAYNYLKAHPEIYLPPVKEPRYYAYKDKEMSYDGLTDKYHINRSSVPSTKEYRALYDDVNPQQHTAVGDASPIYLYSKVAAKEIYSEVPEAKLIAILRDPVQRAYSDYLNMLRLGRDFCTPFRKATEKEEQRIANHWGPFYHYVSKGFYYTQLARYRNYFEQKQMFITTHKQLIEQTKSTMQKIFSFLNVDPNCTIEEYKTYNRSGIPKNIAIHKIITHPLVPLPNFIKNLNITFTKPGLDPELEQELYEIFREEKEKLGKEFDLDLSHWRAKTC